MQQPNHAGKFLSLKWKALLLSSLVLAIVTSSFITLNYIEMAHLFAERRENMQHQYAVQVQALLNQFSERMIHLSTVIASLRDTHAAFDSKGKKNAVEALGALSSSLELSMGIEGVAVLTTDGKILAMHGQIEDNDLPHTIHESISNTVLSEAPVGLIDCSNNCLHYALAPVLGYNGVKGVLVLGASLADVVLGFKGVSGTDLGLIVETKSTMIEPRRTLDSWHAKVVALTNAEHNMSLLRYLSNEESNLTKLYYPRQVAFLDRQVQIRLFPLTGFSTADKAYLVTIADITDTMEHIEKSTRRSVYVGITGLAISEIVLSLILWTPMSRLRRSAENLPLLAKGAFADVRSAISKNLSRGTLCDEVDILNDTAISLSYRLEELSEEVEKRMEEITEERNFVTNILDTAQAIILTQNRHNEILRVNPYGVQLIGYHPDELKGMRFSALLRHETAVSKASEYLKELVDGRREHFELECDLACKDRTVLNIVWQHSRLRRIVKDRSDIPVILSVGMDITARKKAEVDLAWMADHDSLTSLYNRRRFERELSDAIASSRRYGHTGALLFLDLDQFKYINDTSGHSAGDKLLEMLSRSLPRLLREVDIIGRLGGDEFGVILSHANAEDAVVVAKKILAHIGEMKFAVGTRVHKVSASIGIALFPDHGCEVQELLARTDLAMYQVKESGRGGWYLLSDDDKTHRLMHERVLWKQRVENALTEKRFVLYVQPIVNLSDGRASHWEVLLRMLDENDKLVPPSSFIEIAERTGLIHSLDRMVLSEASLHLALMKDWGRKITLTINLSGHAFTDPELLGHLHNVITKYDLDPKQIIFEMTETAAVSDISSARHLMESINDIGCDFALDDFGTGFSSFSYLRQLPFKYIKIDGSFIRHLKSRPDDQVLVKAMADIAVAFRKKTIAEQVEDGETLAYLKQFGIDYAQGFYTGRPVNIKDAFLDR